MRAALIWIPRNSDTITRKITGIVSPMPSWLDISIRIIDTAAAGPASSQYQLAPGS